MNINLQIGSLILDGVDIPHGQHHHLKTSVEAELSRLLVERGLSSGLSESGKARRFAADDVQLTGKSDPGDLGKQIARSVYGGINL